MTGPGRTRARPERPWPPRLRRRSVLDTRKPALLFRFPVVFLLRLAERTFRGSLFHEPPRNTRRQGAGQAPGTGARARGGANHPSRKIARRSRHVSACAACATHAVTRCSTSARPTVPARQRSRSPRSRLRNRRTFASGNRRPPGSSTLRAPYLRYVADFALFADDPARLEAWRARAGRFLEGRRLSLHPAKTRVAPAAAPAEFLGCTSVTKWSKRSR